MLEEMTHTIHSEVCIKGVKTTLYREAKRKLQNPAAANMLILKGTGYGCNFVAQMIFAEKCQEMKGFLLLDIMEWYAVDLSKKTILFIPDADLIVWSNRILHDVIYAAQPGHDLTVIITTDKVQDDRLLRFTLDSSAAENFATAKEKEEYFEYRARAERIRICPNRPGGILEKADEDGRIYKEMPEEMKDSILRLVGDRRWIHRINRFFEQHLFEGSSYFSIAKYTIFSNKNLSDQKSFFHFSFMCVCFFAT